MKVRLRLIFALALVALAAPALSQEVSHKEKIQKFELASNGSLSLECVGLGEHDLVNVSAGGEPKVVGILISRDPNGAPRAIKSIPDSWMHVRRGKIELRRLSPKSGDTLVVSITVPPETYIILTADGKTVLYATVLPFGRGRLAPGSKIQTWL